MTSLTYKNIRRKRKPKKVYEVFSPQDYEAITRALREVICENYEQISKGVHFSGIELERLKTIKARRQFETHYNRFGQKFSQSELITFPLTKIN